MSDEKRMRDRLGWKVLGILSVITFCLGYIGFKLYFIEKGDPRPIFNLLYLSLQLFTLESGSVSGKVSIFLDIARFAAPVIVFWAVIKVIFHYLREDIAALRLRRYRDHIVICGLGEKAFQYLQDFIKNHKVVVIEQDTENDHIPSAQILGAQVLIGDARLNKMLLKARVDHAKYLLAVTGNDLTNIEISEQARIVSEQRHSKGLDCYIHIVNPLVLEVSKVHKGLWERKLKFVPHVFSIYRDAARVIFERSPLDWRPISSKTDCYAHLIIIGFGRMGENILLQAARIGHFANRKRLKVTIVDRMAQVKLQSFLFRYPNLIKICSINALNLEAEDSHVIETVREVDRDENAVISVVVCFKSDEKSLAYALGMAENMEGPGFPVSVRISQGTLLSDLLDNSRIDHLGRACRFGGFGTLDECCTAERLIGQAQDAVARRVHERYREYRNSMPDKTKADKSDPSLQEWDMLMEDLRESNRQSADHIPVKLRAVGCEFEFLNPGESPGTDGFSFTEEEIETLATMEHNRWNAERWLAGWRKGPKDKARRITPYLVEWEELSEDIKNYDRDSVRNIPHLVKIRRKQS